MNELERRVHIARDDREEMERLISEYLPFVKKQVRSLRGMDMRSMEFDDMFSIGLCAFVNSVKRYDPARGSFLSFASICIKSRLIDELRRSKRNSFNASLISFDDADAAIKSVEASSSITQYSKERERAALSEEIGLLRADLKRAGIDFAELPLISPKQGRSRKQCVELARAVAVNDALKRDFMRTLRLPQAALARQFRISVKTVEKYRKYIVAVIIMLLGDYPCIRAFLPKEAR